MMALVKKISAGLVSSALALAVVSASSVPAEATTEVPMQVNSQHSVEAIDISALIKKKKAENPKEFEQIMKTLKQSEALVVYASTHGDIDKQLEPIAAVSSLEQAQQFVENTKGKHYEEEDGMPVLVDGEPNPYQSRAMDCGMAWAAFAAWEIGTGGICAGAGMATAGTGAVVCGIAANAFAAKYVNFNDACK